MKHPVLFEVTKTHPTKHEKLKSFMAEHGVLSHFCGNMEHGKWMALIPIEEDKGKNLFDIMAESCRLYDEAGMIGEAESELQAVRNLCSQRNIPCGELY